MKINKLRLKDILKDYEVWEQEFEYAEVPGIAEIFGYYIVFFDLQKIYAIQWLFLFRLTNM